MGGGFVKVGHAFIFARGGSKGIVGKNIKPLAGRPLICYAIETAQRSPLIDRIFVSTDDHKIARIAIDLGAEVIDRPSELAADSASEWLAWQHAVAHVEMKYGKFEAFISLPATSPLRDSSDVGRALALFRDGHFDGVIGVTESKRSPWFNMVKLQSSGEVEILIKSEGGYVRRQDAPRSYDITTVVYVMRSQYVMAAKGLFDGRIGAIEVPEERAIDLDSPYDFKIADILMRLRKGMNL
jgi:N-acylneuraminate cytidylyltransferase